MDPESSDFLARFDQALAQDASLDQLLGLAIAHLRTDSGTLHVRRGELLHLVAHAAGLPEVVLERIREIPIGKGMAGLAAERAEPVTACNLQTDTSGDVRPGARATGLQGSICVPLLDGQEVVGTLGVANLAEREFDEGERALLLEIGRRLAPRARESS